MDIHCFEDVEFILNVKFCSDVTFDVGIEF